MIPCPSCDGQGRRPIAPEYLSTLEVLGTLKRATCKKLKTVMKRKGLLTGTYEETVIHKRMARLERWGLVRKVERVGPKNGDDARQKSWMFELVKD